MGDCAFPVHPEESAASRPKSNDVPFTARRKRVPECAATPSHPSPRLRRFMACEGVRALSASGGDGGDSGGASDHLTFEATTTAISTIRPVPWRALVAVLFLALSQIQLGVPPAPDALDAGWLQVLGHAHVQGWVWGRDIVHTYGPLGFLHPYLGHDPAVFPHYAFGQVALALGGALVMVGALQGSAGWRTWAVVGWVAVSTSLVKTDAVSYLTVAAAFLVLQDLAATWSSRGRARWWACAAVMALLGVVGLIKFSYFLLGGLAVVLAVARVAGMPGGARAAAGWLAIAAAAWATAWVGVAGQPASAWPAYVSTSLEVSSAYNLAMGQAGHAAPLWIGATTLLAAGGAALAHAVRSDGMRLAAAGGVLFWAAMGFLVWKASFVRQDAGHELGYFLSLSSIALLLWARGATPWGGVAALAALGFVVSYVPLVSSWSQLGTALVVDYRQNRDAALGTFQARQDAQRAHQQMLWALPKTRARAGDGPLDLVGVQQGRVLINGLNYQPRPVFQSHMAHSPTLARMNAAALSGERAPAHVLFQMMPIDGKLPSSEDPLALVELLRRYEWVDHEAGLELLRRRAAASAPAVDREAGTLSLPAGEWVALPAAVASRPQALLSLRLQWSPSWKQRAFAFAVRAPLLRLEVETTTGQRHAYRLSQGAARAGFLVQPLLLDQSHAVAWMTRREHAAGTVSRLRVTREDGFGRDLPGGPVIEATMVLHDTPA